MVSDLMTNSGQWNEELIREIFISVDAAAILRIPLRSQDMMTAGLGSRKSTAFTQ